ncbi:MAG TPA: iron chelate uptake ABC transporter family permease subunit [Nocardioides sp.]|nr:iron chelate uptake ABC transporter family permease subunit [Nocardioides sp.]
MTGAAPGLLAGDRAEDRVERRPVSGGRLRAGVVLGVVGLGVLSVLSLALGSNRLPLSEVIDALSGTQGVAYDIVVGQRLPRTVLALMVGAALAVSGALMQGLTRNPLADPGLLGVQAGASFAVALIVAFFPGLWRPALTLMALVGAVVTTIAVYLVGSSRRRGSSPATLVLAGMAFTAVLAGFTSALALLRPTAFQALRFWNSGDLADKGWEATVILAPFLVVGLLLAATAARGLNAMAMGEDLAASLGSNVRWTRISSVTGVTLLAGAATAAVGPIWFLGLMVPHVARWIVGPDQRWVLAYSLIGGPVLLLASDIVGRLVVADEMPAGITMSFVGAPVLILLVRRRKASGL